MAKLGPALNLSNLLTARAKLRNRVQFVGIELEGGWNQLPTRTSRIIRDGSVRGIETNIVGELPGPPLPVPDFPAWLTKHYPAVVNDTCGMHVHMSFNNLMTYMLLMNPSYPSTIIKGVSEWATNNLPKNHCIWPRLLGESIYCQHVFAADQQTVPTQKDYNQEREGNRYSVVNFPFNRTGTIEVRLLPMMPDAKLAASAIQEVIDITNAFVLSVAKRPGKATAIVEGYTAPSEEVVEIVL